MLGEFSPSGASGMTSLMARCVGAQCRQDVLPSQTSELQTSELGDRQLIDDACNVYACREAPFPRKRELERHTIAAVFARKNGSSRLLAESE